MGSHYSRDAFDAFYASFFEFNEELFQHLARFLDFVPLRILDFACGSGISTRAIAKTFPNSSVWGVDISEDLISSARDTFVPANVRYVAGGVSELISSGALFDLVLVKSAYHLLRTDGIDAEKLIGLSDADGILAILEKTEVCIESYGLFDEATAIWKNQVSDSSRRAMITAFHTSEELDVSTSRFGRTVQIPADAYSNGIATKQISCLWHFSDTFVTDFVQSRKNKSASQSIYEDYDIVIVRRRTRSGNLR